MSTVSSVSSTSTGNDTITDPASSARTTTVTSQNSVSTSTKSKKIRTFDINERYKGQSLENPKTSVIVPKHGLQTVGKVGAGRRVPPPANVGSVAVGGLNNSKTSSSSITAVHNNNNNNENNLVNIVPAGGQGWATNNTADDKCLKDPNSCANQIVLPATDLYSPSSPTTASGGPMILPHYHHQGQNHGAGGVQHRNYPFSEEFPPISAATQEINSKSAKEPPPPNSIGIGGGSGGGSRRESLVDTIPQKDQKLSNMNNAQQHYGGNYVPSDGGCEKESQPATDSSTMKSRINSNNKINSHHSSSSSSSLIPPSAQNSMINTADLFNLPTSSDYISATSAATAGANKNLSDRDLNHSNRNDRRLLFSSQSNQYAGRRSRPEQKRSILEKPLLIDDEELKKLDKILTEEDGCDWIDDKEIDYTQKLRFSDNDSEEEDSGGPGSHSSSAGRRGGKPPPTSRSDSKDDGVSDERFSSRDSRESSSTTARSDQDNRMVMDCGGSAPPPTLYRGAPPPPPTMVDPNNRYYGRKSDSLYEANRKDDYYDTNRRADYHLSSRSQQLPPRNGPPPHMSGAGAVCGPYNTYPVPPFGHPSGPVPPPTISRSLHNQNGPNRRLEQPEENWQPKRPKDEVSNAVLRGRQSRENEDDMMIMPPSANKGHAFNSRDYRGLGGSGIMMDRPSGGDRYPKSQNYPTNLPPRLQKQAEMMMKNNLGYDQRDRDRGRRTPPEAQAMNGIRDYDRHRRTPPEYDNGRNSRYKSQNEPASWRNNQPPAQPVVAAAPPPPRRDSSDHPTGSSSYDTKKPPSYHPMENGDKNDTPVTREQPGPPSEPVKSTVIEDSPTNHAEAIEGANQKQQESSVAEPLQPPVVIKRKEEIVVDEKCPTSDDAAGNQSERKPMPESLVQARRTTPSPQQNSPPMNIVSANNQTSGNPQSTNRNSNNNTTNNNTRTYIANNNSNNDPRRSAERRGVPYDDRRGAGSGDRMPQRKYSNNSDRYTPPLAHQNVPARRNENYRGPPQPNSHMPYPKTEQPEHHHLQQSQGSNNAMVSSNQAVNDRPRQDSFGSSYSNYSSTSPASTLAPVVAAQPVATQSQPHSSTFHPLGSGSSVNSTTTTTIRPSTTYGPPATTKAFSEVSPPVIPQHQNEPKRVPMVEQPHHPPVSVQPPTRPTMPQQHMPQTTTVVQNLPNKQHQAQSQAADRRYRNDQRNDHRNNRSERPANASSGSGSTNGNNQRFRNMAPMATTKPRAVLAKLSAPSGNGSVTKPGNVASVVPTVPTAVVSTNVSPGGNVVPAESDLNNDEWETASESSDLMERTSNNSHAVNRKSSATVNDSSKPSTSSIDSSGVKPSNITSSLHSTTAVTTMQIGGKHGNQQHDRVFQPSAKSATVQNNANSSDAYAKRGGDHRNARNESYGGGPRHVSSNATSIHHSSASSYHRGSSSRLGGGSRSYRGNVVTPNSSNGNGGKRSSNQNYGGGRPPPEMMANQMSKMSLDDKTLDSSDPKSGGGKNRKNSNPQQHPQSSSSNRRQSNCEDNAVIMNNNYGPDESGADGSKQQRKNRTSNSKAKRKERSKSNNRNRRAPNSAGEQPKDSSKTGDKRDHELPKEDGKNPDLKQVPGGSGSNTSSSSSQSVPNDKASMAGATTNKPASFDQQDSGIESTGDHPPSSTSTSQRSSPSNDENKVAVPSSTKLITTASSSACGTKCAPNVATTAATSKYASPDAKQSVPKKGGETPLNLTKIPDMDSPHITNMNNRKLVGTLIYENTKLKEENKTLSKIDPATTSAPVSTSANSSIKGFTNSLTTSTSSSKVNEELNKKIASVKKVWDTASDETNAAATTSQSVERKNSLMSNALINSATDGKAKSTLPMTTTTSTGTVVVGQKKPNANMFIDSTSQMINNASSPPVGDIGRTNTNQPVSFQQTTAAAANVGFHQNVAQTPTSPPTMSQMYPNPLVAQQNLAFQYGQMAADQIPFGPAAAATASQQTAQLTQVFPHAFMQPGTAAAAAAAQQNQFNAMATLMANSAQHAMAATPHHQAASLFMAQLTQAQPALVNEQFNKLTLAAAAANPNMLAQNNMMKPFVHNQSTNGQMNNQHLQQGGWPVQQQVPAASAQHYYAQMASGNPLATASHFVQNSLNASAMIPSTTATGSSSSQISGSQVAANPFNRQQPNLSRNPSMENATQNNAIRSFMGPGHMPMNDMQHHGNAMPHQLQNNSHYIGEQSGSSRNQMQHHNMHHVGHHRNQFQNSNQAQNLNPAAAVHAAASSWSNQQMFFSQKMANGRQYPLQLIGQPMMGSNPAALAAAVQMNSRTSPLTAALMSNSTSNYPNPIQRPAAQQQKGNQPMNNPNQGGGNNSSSNARNNNGGSNKFSSSNMAKSSRQYTNSNRNNSTPSPGGSTAAAAAAATAAVSDGSVVNSKD